MIFTKEESLLIAARRGSPLAVGYGETRILSRLGRVLARALHQPRHLSRRRRHRGRQRRQHHDLRRLGQESEPPDPDRARLGRHGGQGQPRPLHGQGNPRAARSRRPHAVALSRCLRPARGSCRIPSSRCSRTRRDSRCPPVAPPFTPVSSANTGSSSSRGFPSRSMSPPSCAIAARSILRMASRCLSRSRARPPTRSPPCAARRKRASASPPSSTSPRARSRANPKPSGAPMPALRSASPRPRRSPASSRFSPRLRSRRPAPAANR